MSLEIKGLTLEDQFYAVPELIQLCKAKVKTGSAPVWKLDVYHFILEFLDVSEVIGQQTSGTTGKQKIIKLPKKSMLASAKNTIDFFRLKKGDVAVLCLPVQYIAGKMMVVRAMVGGLNLKMIQPSGMPDFSGLDKIDFCAMVPMQATQLLEKKLWPNIKILILGGAETGKELQEQLQHLETKVFETYGMAETCSHVAIKRLNGKDAEDFFTALPDVQLSIDERECLVVEAGFLPEKVVTNDRVEISDSYHFRWLGRFDNVINSGGIKIQPEEMEKQFQEILQTPCNVIGESDELLGQKVVLVLESSNPEDPKKLLKKLSPYFDKKVLPKEIYFLKEFPRNKSFKVDRNEIRKLIQKEG